MFTLSTASHLRFVRGGLGFVSKVMLHAFNYPEVKRKIKTIETFRTSFDRLQSRGTGELSDDDRSFRA